MTVAITSIICCLIQYAIVGKEFKAQFEEGGEMLPAMGKREEQIQFFTKIFLFQLGDLSFLLELAQCLVHFLGQFRLLLIDKSISRKRLVSEVGQLILKLPIRCILGSYILLVG